MGRFPELTPVRSQTIEPWFATLEAGDSTVACCVVAIMLPPVVQAKDLNPPSLGFMVSPNTYYFKLTYSVFRPPYLCHGDKQRRDLVRQHKQ